LITPVVDRLSPCHPEFIPKLKYTCGVVAEVVVDMMAAAMADRDPAVGTTQTLSILILGQQSTCLWAVAAALGTVAPDQVQVAVDMAAVPYWLIIVAHTHQDFHWPVAVEAMQALAVGPVAVVAAAPLLPC
jgi:hypothetical protein